METMKSLLLAVLVIAVTGGCSVFSTTNPRAVSIDDIIAMSKAGVGTAVIISHIQSTHSKYNLTTADIVRLKNEGVSDDVLKAMIQSEHVSSAQKPFDWEYPDWWYSPYDNWSNFNYFGGNYFSPYDYPYIVYRQPGLLGKFYNYYPLDLSPKYGPYERYYPPSPGLPYSNPEVGKPTNPDSKKPSNP